MKYKVSNIPIKGIQWQCQLNLESEWQTMKETAPDQYFLTKKKFPFPKDEITVIYDQHNEAYPLITQAIKISKKKLKSDLKRLWEPGEIGGNYYVGINEGAGFCESDNIGMVGTSGLLGCCALMVKGKVDDEYRIYVSHVNSGLMHDEEARNSEFKKISDDLIEYFKEAKKPVSVTLVSNRAEGEEKLKMMADLLVLENKDSPLHALNHKVGIDITLRNDGEGEIYFDMTEDEPILLIDESENSLVNTKDLKDCPGHGQASPPFGHTEEKIHHKLII